MPLRQAFEAFTKHAEPLFEAGVVDVAWMGAENTVRNYGDQQYRQFKVTLDS